MYKLRHETVLWPLAGTKAARRSLASIPELEAQWHPDENEERSPSSTLLGSNYRATWLCTACPCGHPHIWQAEVKARAKGSKSGCPFCVGRIPCRCKSLAVLAPEVRVLSCLQSIYG